MLKRLHCVNLKSSHLIVIAGSLCQQISYPYYCTYNYCTAPHDAFKNYGGCDINCSLLVTVTNEPNSIYLTCLCSRTRFIVEKPRTREEQCFWCRAPVTANWIATAVDFFNAVVQYVWLCFSIQYQECNVTPTLGEYDSSRSHNYHCINLQVKCAMFLNWLLLRSTTMGQ